MKKLATVVLTMVVLLGVSTTALAAAPPGDQISNTLTLTGLEATKTGWITLSWVGDLPTSAMVGKPVTVTVKATRNTSEAIDRVLYIIKVTKDGVGATNADVEAVANGQDGAGNPNVVNVPVGYLEAGLFYFGDLAGFKLSAPEVMTEFTITFKTAGKYSIEAYAIQVQ